MPAFCVAQNGKLPISGLFVHRPQRIFEVREDGMRTQNITARKRFLCWAHRQRYPLCPRRTAGQATGRICARRRQLAVEALRLALPGDSCCPRPPTRHGPSLNDHPTGMPWVSVHGGLSGSSHPARATSTKLRSRRPNVGTPPASVLARAMNDTLASGKRTRDPR